MRHLRAGAELALFLGAPLEELRRRLTNMDRRGIASPTEQNLAEIFAERWPLCLRHRDARIHCAGKTPAELATDMAAALKGRGAWRRTARVDARRRRCGRPIHRPNRAGKRLRAFSRIGPTAVASAAIQRNAPCGSASVPDRRARGRR